MAKKQYLRCLTSNLSIVQGAIYEVASQCKAGCCVNIAIPNSAAVLGFRRQDFSLWTPEFAHKGDQVIYAGKFYGLYAEAQNEHNETVGWYVMRRDADGKDEYRYLLCAWLGAKYKTKTWLPRLGAAPLPWPPGGVKNPKKTFQRQAHPVWDKDVKLPILRPPPDEDDAQYV